VLVGLAMFTVTMFGFVVNDVLDFKKDVGAGVLRPIAMGTVSRQVALAFAVLLLAVAGWISVAVGAGSVVLMLTAVALIVYTPWAQHLPFVKGLYVAGLCIAPLYYASVVSRFSISVAAYATLALYILGREILMDANEIAGDRLAGMKTVAVVMGQGDARWLGVVMMVVSLTCLNLVAKGVVGRTSAVVSAVSLVFVLLWPRMDEDRRIAFSRLPMLAAVMAVSSR
jgi:geranylgeranylglycerol-phosphate geranylgeranyltransferase